MNINLNLNEITPVIKEIDGAYVVWFANCNQYLWLDEPAFFVFCEEAKGAAPESISLRCAQRYRATEEESARFVTEITCKIRMVKQTHASKKSVKPEIEGVQQVTLSAPYSIRHYMVNEKPLRFCFEDRLCEHYLHPLLQHLETGDNLPSSYLFELFGHNGKTVLQVDGNVKGAWGEEDTHLLKGMAFLQILNIAYEKEDHDWMAILHASAVTNGKKTIVFTAAPGSGKSTMAVLLQQKGFSLVSDDFVPIERFSGNAFPFPAAMSVKEGAAGLLSVWYPSLQNQEKQQSASNKQVRYLPVDGKTAPAPVNEIVFIQYNPSVDFEMEKLTRDVALKMLLDETWTSPVPENAARFLDWFSAITYYQLSYSDNARAILTIDKLFR